MALVDSKGRITMDNMFMEDMIPIIQNTGLMITEDGELIFELIDHIIPIYVLTSSLQPQANSDTQISYEIKLECTNKVDPGRQLSVSITMPAGFTLVQATSNEGTFNPTTGKWTLLLDSDDTATLNMLVDISGTGSETQTISLDGSDVTLETNCDVYATDPDGTIASHSIDLADYPDTLANMQDGELYTIVTYSRVHETGVTGIHSGMKNNTISVTNDIQTVGTRATLQNYIQKIICTFIYDSSSGCVVTWFDQYQTVSTDTEDRHYGLCVNEGYNTEYSASKDLLTSPGALFDDTSASDIIIEGGDESAEYVYEIPVPELTGDNNPFYNGIELQLNSFLGNSNLEVYLKTSNGTISNVQSTYINHTGLVQFGDPSDLWDLTDGDLEGTLEVHLKISNTSSILQTFSFNNLTLYLYYQDDETGGRYGFTLGGVHSKNYNIILSDDDNPSGLAKSISTLERPKTDGVLITDDTAGAKKIKLTCYIRDSTFINTQRLLNNITRWMSNNKNEYNNPIPKQLILDYDPYKEYSVVLDDSLDVTKKGTWIKFQATFLVPSGAATNTTQKITGSKGTNNGLTKVRPLIVVEANGSSSITITDTVNTSLKVGLDVAVASGTVLSIDCEERTITDEAGTDYTEYITLDTVWPAIPPGEYSLNITGGSIRYVAFYEEQ